MTAESNRLRDALAKLEPAVRDAFIAAIQTHASSVDLTAVVAAIERGDIQAAVDMLVPSQGGLFPLTDAVRQAFIAGGMAVEGPAAVRGSFAFDGRHVEAERIIAQQGAALVQGIQDEAKEAVRGAITTGLAEGRGTRAVALDITGRRGPNGQRTGGIIGLTSEQTDAVMTARAVLSNPARLGEYFRGDAPRWKLSDRRYDGLIRKAIAGKVKLTAKDIDKIVDAHKSRALKFRGALIAKNEAAQGIAEGQYQAYRQMADNPRIAYVTAKWSHGLSLEPRLDHVAMSGTTIRLGQTFNFPDGVAMRFPHDPNAPARHTLNCRCVAIYRAVPRITGVNDG